MSSCQLVRFQNGGLKTENPTKGPSNHVIGPLKNGQKCVRKVEGSDFRYISYLDGVTSTNLQMHQTKILNLVTSILFSSVALQILFNVVGPKQRDKNTVSHLHLSGLTPLDPCIGLASSRTQKYLRTGSKKK